MPCIENKMSSQGILYIQYILSWIKVGGNLETDIYWNGTSWADEPNSYKDFRKWLSSLGLPEEEIKEICSMSGLGKLELEDHAKKFMKEAG